MTSKARLGALSLALGTAIGCASSSAGNTKPETAAGASGTAAAGTSSSNAGTGTDGTSGSTNAAGAPGAAGAAGALQSQGGAPTVDHPPNPCSLKGGCPPGLWVNVTPPSINLKDDLSCGNVGAKTVQADPSHPQDLYTLFTCQGIWKSSDYGQTWKGPINTGNNAAMIGDCAGGITISSQVTGAPPVIYAGCIRGAGTGFWSSRNAGVDWNRFTGPEGSANQYYPPTVDPHDVNHLLMPGHAVNVLGESFDGGEHWTLVTTDPKMKMMGGTGEIAFVDNGDLKATRATWLWTAAASGMQIGTWRTSDSGAHWTRVETNEHVNGANQVYQPDTSGVIYMAGLYSAAGDGVFRSTDFGQTWSHVGAPHQQTVVYGTTRFVYSMYGSGAVSPAALQSSPQPGTGPWSPQQTPTEMTMGAEQVAVTNDGTNYIVLAATTVGGIWRYVEPAP